MWQLVWLWMGCSGKECFIRNSVAQPTRDGELVMLLSKKEIYSFLAWVQPLESELALFLKRDATLTD